MNLTVEQMRSLANLIENAETMVELYWDTDNGHKLSRSLQSVRVAFGDLRHGESDAVDARPARLIIEAQCAICGPLDDQCNDGLSTVRLAMGHSSALGHVVILNGTADLPDASEDPSIPGSASGDSSQSAVT